MESTGLSNAYADTCLQAAIELYAMAKAKPGYQQGNSYGAPYRYNEDTWTDDLEWATELLDAPIKRISQGKQFIARLSNTQSWIQRIRQHTISFIRFLILPIIDCFHW